MLGNEDASQEVWVRVWRKDVRELAKGQTNGARDDPG